MPAATTPVTRSMAQGIEGLLGGFGARNRRRRSPCSRAFRPSGIPPSRLRACVKPAYPPMTRALARRAAGSLRRRSGPRRLVREGQRRAARRLAIRIRQRQLPGHRRQRRGAHRPAPAQARRGGRSPDRSRGIDWLLAMQSKNGGWGAFDRDNTRKFVTQDPVRRFRRDARPAHRRRDRSRARMAHARWAAPRRAGRNEPPAYLRKTQESDGSWWGRWGMNYVYGHGRRCQRSSQRARPVEPANPRGSRMARRRIRTPTAVGAKACRSYEDARPSRPGQAPPPDRMGAARPARGRRSHSRGGAGVHTSGDAGSRRRVARRQFTGTGFPRDFMSKYHLYRNYWPLWALGRYRRLRAATDSSARERPAAVAPRLEAPRGRRRSGAAGVCLVPRFARHGRRTSRSFPGSCPGDSTALRLALHVLQHDRRPRGRSGGRPPRAPRRLGGASCGPASPGTRAAVRRARRTHRPLRHPGGPVSAAHRGEPHGPALPRFATYEELLHYCPSRRRRWGRWCFTCSAIATKLVRAFGCHVHRVTTGQLLAGRNGRPKEGPGLPAAGRP